MTSRTEPFELIATRSRAFQQEIRYHDRTHANIGVIVPFDFGIDWEYWRYLPAEVALHFTRTPYIRKPVGVGLAKDLGRVASIRQATRALGAVQPAATLYACSSASFVRGLEGERALRQVMLDAGARRAVTTSGAMVEALRATHVRRISVATPYTGRLTRHLIDFLEEAGFTVVSSVHLGLTEGIDRVSKSTIAELVRSARTEDSEATFVSCTALRTYGIVTALEEEIGRPVFTSNQVSLWAVLKAGGVLYQDVDDGDPDQILGGGRPMARSTELLLQAAAAEHRVESA